MKRSPLSCPDCQKKLKFIKSTLTCPECRKTIGVKGNKYDFMTGEDYYWGEISQNEAKQLLKQAEREGFARAAYKLELKQPGMYQYVLSYSRADWVFDCLDLDNTKRCLDVGSGWGAITFALSYHYDEVWSLESVNERIEFQRIRAKQERRDNIFFVKKDWLKLPFADESFDLVCLNGVLEWIGLSDFSKSPKRLQNEFLKEVKRVLKPEGCVYIGIENRFAAFYWLGALDHSGIPFTSLMPRKVADYAVRAFRRTQGKYARKKRMAEDWDNYRTYTYSLAGYQNLLKNSGFNRSKFHWALTYNSPTEAGRFDGNSFRYLLRLFSEHDFNITLLSKLATRFGVLIPKSIIKVFWPMFVPGFLIYSFKKRNGRNRLFVNQLISSSTKKLKINKDLNNVSYLRRSGTHGLTSKVNYILLNNTKPLGVLKFSRFNQFSSALEKEERLLQKWNDIDIKRFNIGGKKIYLEPYLKGKICSTNGLNDNIKAIKWLIDFQNSTKGGLLSVEDFSKNINGTDRLLSMVALSNNLRSRIEKRIDIFLKELKKQKLYQVAEHGDFVKTNIIIDKDSVNVLDWEFYNEKGDPFFDFMFYIINNSRVGSMPKVFIGNFTGVGKYSNILNELMKLMAKEKQLTTDLYVKSFDYVVVRAMSRRFFDENFRHLDTSPFIELLRVWDNINKEALVWFTK